MNSQELADAVILVCMDANRRILGVGDASYAYRPFQQGGRRQRHEDETLDDHLRGLEEELLDQINWASMAILKIRERRARIETSTNSPDSGTT